MPLQSGTRLGSYEILAPIGAGGMGEVYRARDGKLNREVAIKVLPEEFIARPDALARFEREAKAVAALSHPNILAIHDFGAADPPTGSGQAVTFAVMELLEGETLRGVLATRDSGLGIRKSLEYAVQIARGLAAAHDKGIVHRDLKPENVFITADDRVKILDFGLARQDTSAVAAATMTPTVNNPTEPGVVLGTVGYMAPEQVRGVAVDARADLFSFGALLYEMVTGVRAFQRETAAETMTAILREDPPEPPPARSIPPAVDRIIRHCLEKKPDARFRSAADLAFALDAAAGATSSTSSSPEVPPAVRLRSSPRWIAAALIVAAVVAAGAAGVWIGRHSAAGGSRESTPASFRQLTFNRGSIWAARFASDGKTLVYSASWDRDAPKLFLTRPEFPGASPLSLPAAVLLGISRNGEIAIGLNPFRRFEGANRVTLARTPMLGGAPTMVLENVTYADWNPAGDELAIVRQAGSRQILEYPIGTVLFETEGEIGHPRVSPDGREVAFLDWPVKNDDRGSVAIVDRSRAKRTISRTWEAVRGLAWRPDGREVWYTAASAGTSYVLWATGAGSAAERPVFAAPGGIILQDIAHDGRLLVSRYDRSVHSEGVFDGGESRELSWLDFQFARDISRDGRRVLLTHSGHGASQNYDVYIRGTRDNETTRLGEGQAQQFSPDGKSALSVVHGPPSKLVILPIGPGDTRTVATGGVTVTNARWLGDGSRLLVVGAEGAKPSRAYVVDTGGGTPRPITPEGITFASEQIAVSPDGTRVAFRAPDGALMLYSTTGAAPRPAKGFVEGETPGAWTADGRSLLLVERAPERRLIAVDPESGRRSTVITLKPSDSAVTGPSQVVLAPDGRSYAAIYGRRLDTLFLVEGLR